MKKILLFLFIGILSFMTAQVAPPKDLHTHPPRAWALTNGIIHTSPGQTIENGTVVLRNGVIEAVGQQVKIPGTATVIDLDGQHVYAGFIESWLDVESATKDSSLRSHWNSNMRAHQKVVDQFQPKKKSLDELRSLGFTTAHLIPKGGIFQGHSALIQLNETGLTLNASVGQAVDFHYGGWGSGEYPTSLLGSIAFIRQGLYDADWYGKSMAILDLHPDGNEPIQEDRSLADLYAARKQGAPFIFTVKDDVYSLRAKTIAEEFGLNLWLKGNGFEYRRLTDIAAAEPFLILPLNFPGKPKVAHPHEALQYTTKQLKHWDMAPDNPAKLHRAGISFSITSAGLKEKKQFRVNLARSVERGLNEEYALAALTTIPAEKFDQATRLGKIKKGFVANLTIVDGNYFEEKSIVRAVWINGEEFKINPKAAIDPSGEWTLKENDRNWALNISKITKGYKGKLTRDSISISLKNLALEQDRISWTVDTDTILQAGVTRFSGTIADKRATGQVVYADGIIGIWSANQDSVAVKEKKDKKKAAPSDLTVFFPEGAYGMDTTPKKPKTILVNDATIWTSGPKGVLKGWDILFQNGRVKKIARNIALPRGGALIIEGKGKHVTPGLLDAHSHMAAASINEGFQSVTAEVRMRDVLEPDDISIYRALAGGLTIINLLHGSANPIGGQNAVLKLRWGSSDPQSLIYNKAPQGIKFALGENVKRSNWNDPTNRYPKTRMGVEQVIRDGFQAANDYKKQWDIYNKNSKLQKTKIPPRRDLELDALVEILEGSRLLHCHSYRQDEILMLTRVAEDFGFTIGTFQHVLEGYKVAERIKEHGAGASTFSDWWAYKYEVIDAIPFNGALMADVGVNVSFNSDSDELARRMNLEAAKAVKYGGISETEALKFVTINPAKQLKIDDWVGSLEPGKDADFVIWSGHPLSTYSVCEQTWINGVQYFSLEQDNFFRQRDKKLRNDLIQKILKAPDNGDPAMQPNGDKKKHYSCSLEGIETFEGGE